MKPFMYVEYAFVFDPADTWQQMYEFEHMLDEYLETIGLEAEKINPMVPGGKGIIYIKKKCLMEEMSEDKSTEYNPATSKVKIKVKLPKE